ncbi:hypothetical protein HYDPIDRAFT_39021 [Hydnomerulius pinastri MD-312]|nr:hypothetical protein HYDPIDRAFT_39021 [Hydnomerulius pinastri MD-312]
MGNGCAQNSYIRDSRHRSLVPGTSSPYSFVFDMEHILPFIPPNMLGFPRGMWGISYDISTRRTEDNLPYGWDAPRASTYAELKSILQRNRFVRLQYSDWRCEKITAVEAFAVMVSLRHIRPVGKFESTVIGLKMHYIRDFAILNVTEKIQYGGEFSRRLRGLTPAGLVPNAGLNHHPAIPQGPIRRPFATRNSEAVGNPHNWRV